MHLFAPYNQWVIICTYGSGTAIANIFLPEWGDYGEWKMRYALKRIIVGGQRQMIATYGDDVWGELCDTFTDKFRLSDAVEKLDCIRHLAPQTRYWVVRCVLLNVIDDAAERPEEYENRCPVRRYGSRWYDLLG
jgi:hypothetical protein